VVGLVLGGSQGLRLSNSRINIKIKSRDQGSNSMGGWDRCSRTKDFKKISGGPNLNCKKKTMVMCFLL
jgi:hypothetical protein